MLLFSWELDDGGAVEGMEMEMELESGCGGGGAKWACLGRESEGNFGVMKGGVMEEEVERWWRVSGIVATEPLATWSF